jgi:hypothetical protein
MLLDGLYIFFENRYMVFLQMMGPQCNLYVPAPVLKQGENVVVGDVKTYIFHLLFLTYGCLHHLL